MSLPEIESRMGIIVTASNQSLEEAKKIILNYQPRSTQVDTHFPAKEEIKSIGKKLLRKALYHHKT